MSTATFEGPLHAVPNVPPSTKARFASLLALRDAAYRAFDKALSLPRSAIRWVVDLSNRWVEASGSMGVISWLSARARDAAGLFRRVGVLPSVLAVLSTPPIAAAAGRVVKFVGRGLLRVASSAWTGLKALLGRCGSTGTRIAEGLGRAGAYVADAVMAVAQHPVMAPVAQALKATIALVRPVSWAFVTHRLLGVLVPIIWIRAVVELLIFALHGGLQPGRQRQGLRVDSINRPGEQRRAADRILGYPDTDVHQRKRSGRRSVR